MTGCACDAKPLEQCFALLHRFALPDLWEQDFFYAKLLNILTEWQESVDNIPVNQRSFFPRPAPVIGTN